VASAKGETRLTASEDHHADRGSIDRPYAAAHDRGAKALRESLEILRAWVTCSRGEREGQVNWLRASAT